MPVTFKVAEHPAEDFTRHQLAENPEDILRWAANDEYRQCREILQTSILPEDIPKIVPQGNGFVQAVLTAYKQHHNLVIRPDDVWMSILCQIGFYINAHAEELRTHFVVHEGKERLIVPTIGTRYTADYASIARQMARKIQDFVVDPSLVDWILPDFTTTTTKDTTICAVLMMASLKSYFEYHIMCICGIPSVTLEGERADWQKLLDRVTSGRLAALGAEPAAWARMLQPILERFVKAFDGEPDVEFWQSVAHAHPVFYGPDDMSGWITAFSVWDIKGHWRGRPLAEVTNPPPVPDAEKVKKLHPMEVAQLERRYVLDGISYPALSQSQITQGFCQVDIIVEDNGEKFDCVMIAGQIAFTVSGTAETRQDTLSPSPEWFIYVKCTQEEKMEMLRDQTQTLRQ